MDATRERLAGRRERGSEAPSISEDRGLALLCPGDLNIYSVGISTAGVGEARMARADPRRRVIATTVDPHGGAVARSFVAGEGLSGQIDVRIEDVRRTLPHPDEAFDFVYSRLALHYLTPVDLDRALRELRRVLRDERRLFCVVRSVAGMGVDSHTVRYDAASHATIGVRPDGSTVRAERYLQTNASIVGHVERAGFVVESVADYDEVLFADFERRLAPGPDHVIEVVAHRPG